MVSKNLQKFLDVTTQTPAGEKETGSFSPATIVAVGGGRTVCWTDELPAEDPTTRIKRWMNVINPPGGGTVTDGYELDAPDTVDPDEPA